MSEQFSNSQPIYLQLVQRICRQIVRQEVKPGDKLPSVRDLAVKFGVNPNTMQRVNMELERMEIVESRRGQGMFVSENQERLTALREQLKEEQIRRFVGDMQELGYTAVEIVEGIQAYIRQ